MKTFQDLIKTDENDRGDFCYSAITAFRSSREYLEAQEGQAYYDKHNLTIEKYQNMLYTVSGKQVPNIFSADYRLKTLIFRRLVTQQVQYVLGNGIFLSDTGNKEKLGKTFDFKLQEVAKKAMAQGRAFGFWNVDHLEVFGYADTAADPGFCPLYDEETGNLAAGIRYWYKTVGNAVITRMTLYEADGYTEYKKSSKKKTEILEPKRSYKLTVTETAFNGVEDTAGENYEGLPIVCLYANDTHASELVGVREKIDCFDFIESGLANNIDDTSGFYWILKNSGGMDDVDLARFVQRMHTVKASVLDGDDVSAEAHTLDIPYQARQVMLETLRSDIYEDFQALDVKTLSAAAKTTQEIQAAYQSQDNKCADFEFMLIDFVQKVLALAGIDDEPTFRWNRVVNQLEQTQMILSAASYLDDATIIKHLPFLTPEEAENVITAREGMEMDQFNAIEDE